MNTRSLSRHWLTPIQNKHCEAEARLHRGHADPNRSLPEALTFSLLAFGSSCTVSFNPHVREINNKVTMTSDGAGPLSPQLQRPASVIQNALKYLKPVNCFCFALSGWRFHTCVTSDHSHRHSWAWSEVCSVAPIITPNCDVTVHWHTLEFPSTSLQQGEKLRVWCVSFSGI